MKHNLISTKEEIERIKICEDLLCAIGLHYHAASACLFSCGVDNSIALAASWRADTMPHKELHINDAFVSKWKEQLGTNRAVFVPEGKGIATLLDSAMPRNLLGELRGESEKPSLLLLLENIVQKEEGYGYLETACELLHLNDRLFEAADVDNKKSRDEPLKLMRQLEMQKKQFSREIRRKDEIQRVLGEQTRVWVFEWGRNPDNEQGFLLSYISPALAVEFQFYRRDIHLFTYLLVTNRIYEADLERFCEFLKDTSILCSEIVCRITGNGVDYFWYRLTKRIIYDETEQEEHMIGTVLNVDDEIRADRQSKCMDRLDALTGLLNQKAFYAESEKLLNDNKDCEYAFIIIDIDNFKLINSLHGMNVGNEVLAQIGQTLLSCISKADLCARAYADVFYIATAYQSDELIINLIQKIMDRLSYVEYAAMLQPCFGISNSKDSERTVTLLCELANFAHKHGKGNTREHYTFYDVSIRQTIIEEKQMESEMEFALQSGQFQVYLQPKYIISTREIIGAEALVRWEHPSKGMIGPAKFISLFEKNGFILKLDEYIWEQVCVILHKWQASGANCIPISVNMSRLHLNNRNFQSTIVTLLQKYHISHEWFELELTENLLFENLSQMITVLSGLQDRGFYINMDDFGSGYSSLNMLRNIPIDVLKIDGNFFDEKMLTPKGKTIVKYVVSMAKELNMQVVAEGVETYSQEKFLLEVGCEIAQGFYFSKPMSVTAFESKCWHTT